MKYVRNVLALFAAVICCTITYSQKIDSALKTNGSQKVVVNPDANFYINLTNDSLSLTHRNKPLALNNFQELDDYMKNNVQSIDHIKVVLTNPMDTKYDRVKIIMDILKKYKISNFTHFVSNKTSN